MCDIGYDLLFGEHNDDIEFAAILAAGFAEPQGFTSLFMLNAEHPYGVHSQAEEEGAPDNLRSSISDSSQSGTDLAAMASDGNSDVSSDGNSDVSSDGNSDVSVRAWVRETLDARSSKRRNWTTTNGFGEVVGKAGKVSCSVCTTESNLDSGD
jgi:hypothetical protein